MQVTSQPSIPQQAWPRAESLPKYPNVDPSLPPDAINDLWAGRNCLMSSDGFLLPFLGYHPGTHLPQEVMDKKQGPLLHHPPPATIDAPYVLALGSWRAWESFFKSKIIISSSASHLCIHIFKCSHEWALQTQKQTLWNKETHNSPVLQNKNQTNATPKTRSLQVKLGGKNPLPIVPYPESYGVIHLFKTHSWVHVKSVMDQQGDIISMFSSPQTMTAFKLPTKKCLMRIKENIYVVKPTVWNSRNEKIW